MSMNELVLKYVMRPQRMFTPAANVADAMSVLLELESRGWQFCIRTWKERDYRVEIYVHKEVDDGKDPHVGHDSMLTYAICEAAVKACGATDDEVRDANR